jgi:enoyl-CoA hydratase/carnithine racemase
VLEQSDQPIGERVYVTSFGHGNRVTLSDGTARTLFPRRTPALLDAYEFVNVHRDGHLLEVTINRPDARNSLHPPAHEELDGVFDAFFADPDLWVAIITGEGTKAFCAGNDLLYGVTGKPVYVPLNGFGGLTSRRNMHKPIIAAVNGFAMGGGFEIVLACHLVVADESAKFALSEVKVGLIAGAGGLIRLPRTIPRTVATELILTGRRIGSQEASHLGIVNRIAPEGDALSTARELAAEILEGSPTSVRLSLKLMEQTQGIADTLDAVSAPTDVIDELMTSADAIEGMTASPSSGDPSGRTCDVGAQHTRAAAAPRPSTNETIHLTRKGRQRCLTPHYPSTAFASSTSPTAAPVSRDGTSPTWAPTSFSSNRRRARRPVVRSPDTTGTDCGSPRRTPTSAGWCST